MLRILIEGRKNRCVRETCVRVWRGNRNREKEQPSAGFGDASPKTGSERFRSGAHCHGNTEVSQGLNFLAGAAFWQGRVQVSWQAQRFRKVKYRFRGRRGIFLLLARTRRKSHWHGRARRHMQISWQGQHFRKVKHRFRGRGSIFAGSRTYFVAVAAFSQGQVAGAAISQGEVQISWQAQYFRDRRYDYIFPTAARKSQKLSKQVVFEVHFSSCRLKMGKVKCKGSFRSGYLDEAS